jgi:hypothetical protein
MALDVDEDLNRSTRQRNGIHEPNPYSLFFQMAHFAQTEQLSREKNGNSCTIVRLAHVIGEGEQPREFVSGPRQFFRFAPGNEHLAAGTEVARGEARGQSLRLLR